MYKQIIALLLICFAFTFNAIECQGNDEAMEIEFQNSAASSNFTISLNSQTVVFGSIEAGQGRQFYEVCLSFNVLYTFDLHRDYSDSTGNSCEGGSDLVIHPHDEWVVIRYHNTEVHRRALPRSTDNSDYVKCSLNPDQRTLTLTEPEYFIPPNSDTWLYSDEIQYSLEWTNVDQPISFTTFEYGTTYTRDFRYYRNTFTLDNLEENFILYIDLYSPYAFVVYVNSIEAFRSNIRQDVYLQYFSNPNDNSTVDHWRTVILKTSEYVKSVNNVTFGIEVHLPTNTSKNPVSDLFNCAIRKFSAPRQTSIPITVPASATKQVNDEYVDTNIMDGDCDTGDYTFLSSPVRYKIDFGGSGIWFDRITLNVHLTNQGGTYFGDKGVYVHGNHLRNSSDATLLFGYLKPTTGAYNNGTHFVYDGNFTITNRAANYFTYSYFTLVITGGSTTYSVTVNEVYFDLFNQADTTTNRIQYDSLYYYVDGDNFVIRQQTDYTDLTIIPSPPSSSTYVFDKTTGQFTISYLNPTAQSFRVCRVISNNIRDCAYVVITLLVCPSVTINGFSSGVHYVGTSLYRSCDPDFPLISAPTSETDRYSVITCQYIDEHSVSFETQYQDHCNYDFLGHPYDQTSFAFYVGEPVYVPFNQNHFYTSLSTRYPNGLQFNSTDGSIYGTPTLVLSPARTYALNVNVGPLSYVYDIEIKIIARNCSVLGEWPEILINETASLPCPTGFNGNRTRFCRETGSYQSINYDGCSIIDPPYPYAESNYVFTVGDTVSIPVIDILNYPATSFSTSSLPEGLSIDPTSGTISGTGVYTPETTYTITVSNNRNLNGQLYSTTVYHSITITVNAQNCPQEFNEGTWELTDVNTNRTIECPSDHYNGYKTRLCKIDGSWDAIYDTCVPKDPVYPYSTYDFTLRIETDLTIEPIIEDTRFTEISIEPGLPQGLSMDTTTGIISGNIANVMQRTQYTLTVKNIDKSNQYTMYIEFVNTCLTDDIWPETTIGTTVTKSCSSDLVGVRRRTCLADGSWSDIEEECIPHNITCIGESYYNSITGSCESCSSGYTVYSKACNSNMKCIHCETGEVLINGECISNPPTCSSIDGWPTTPAGYTSILDCDSSTNPTIYGTKTRKCVYNNGVAEWDDVDDTLCRTVNTTLAHMQFDFDLNIGFSSRHYSHDLLIPLMRSFFKAYNYNLGRLYLKYVPSNPSEWDSALSAHVSFISNTARAHFIDIYNLTETLQNALTTNLQNVFSNHGSSSGGISLGSDAGVSYSDVNAQCTNPSGGSSFNVLYNSNDICSRVDQTFTQYFCTQYEFEPVPLINRYVSCKSPNFSEEAHIGFTITFSEADFKYLFCGDKVAIYRGILASFKDYGVKSLRITSMTYDGSNTVVGAYIVPLNIKSVNTYKNIINNFGIYSNVTTFFRNTRFNVDNVEGTIVYP